MSQPNIDYCFYATLLDGFTDYLNSDQIWETYWGWSENPSMTVDEFREKQFQSLIDRINRVPFDSEPADKGTAFNELVDCLVEHRAPSDLFHFEKIYKEEVIHHPEQTSFVDNMDFTPAYDEVRRTNELIGIKVYYNERQFFFDIRLVREFSNYYHGALTQQFCEGVLQTRYGNVRLYGYIDELLPQSVHDIKTTSRYSVGKFKDHSQHLVYPFCLQQSGNNISLFEYNIAVIDKYGHWETFTESYSFNPVRDIPIIRSRCEDFIEFLIEHRDLIADRKIFNFQSTK